MPAHGSSGTQAGLPSRHAHLIISLGGPIDVVGMPDPRQRPGKFHMLVNGLQDAPAFVTGGADMDMLHLFLKPHGVQALLGVPCATLVNRVVELTDLWGSAATLLFERLLGAGLEAALRHSRRRAAAPAAAGFCTA